MLASPAPAGAFVPSSQSLPAGAGGLAPALGLGSAHPSTPGLTRRLSLPRRPGSSAAGLFGGGSKSATAGAFTLGLEESKDGGGLFDRAVTPAGLKTTAEPGAKPSTRRKDKGKERERVAEKTPAAEKASEERGEPEPKRARSAAKRESLPRPRRVPPRRVDRSVRRRR